MLIEALHNSLGVVVDPPKSRKKRLHNTTFWSSWPFYFICHLHALHMHYFFFFSMRKPRKTTEALRCWCKSLTRSPPRRRSSSTTTTTTGGIFLLFSPQKYTPPKVFVLCECTRVSVQVVAVVAFWAENEKTLLGTFLFLGTKFNTFQELYFFANLCCT